MNAPVRITVLRRLRHPEYLAAYAEGHWPVCQHLHDGQVFISAGACIPEAFCSWAWSDIHKYVMTLARGGNFRGVRAGTYVTCCTDGFRPVLFLLERLPEDA